MAPRLRRPQTYNEGVLDTSRLVCSECGSWTTAFAGAPRTCVECGGALRKPGALERLVDGLLTAPSGHIAPAFHRHLQLVQELWTEGGRDQQLYAALRPRMSLSKFTSQVTEVVCRGLEEGWIVLHLPIAPTNDDAAYELEFKDPDRFADELAVMFRADR